MGLDDNDGREAERYDALATAAFERFKTRLEWEWKARLALWTALAVATGFVISNETWQPTPTQRWTVVAIGLILVAIYGICFSFPVHKLHQLDIEDRLASEWRIRQLCDASLRTTPQPPQPKGRKLYAAMLSAGQFLITAMFAAALIAAVLTKAPKPNTAASARVLVEGREHDAIHIAPP